METEAQRKLIEERANIKTNLFERLDALLALEPQINVMIEALTIIKQRYLFTKTWYYSPVDQHDIESYPETKYTLQDCLTNLLEAARKREIPDLRVGADKWDEERYQSQPFEVIYNGYHDLFLLMNREFTPRILEFATELSDALKKGTDLKLGDLDKQKLIAGFALLAGTKEEKTFFDELAERVDFPQIDLQFRRIYDITEKLPEHLKYATASTATLLDAGKAALEALGIPSLPPVAAGAAVDPKAPPTPSVHAA